MKIRIIIFLLVLPFLLAAQAKYIVFKTIGNVECYSTKTKQWERLKVKDSISNESKLKCPKNSTLVVFDSKYRIYEIKHDGEVLLKNSIPAGNPNSSKEMQKAVKFFVEQTFAASSNGTTQKVKGAVYRGEESVFPWDSAIIIDDSFDLIINLSRTSYPVKVSLNDYSLIIYSDTTLRLSSSNLSEEHANLLKVGNRPVVHLFRETKKSSVAIKNMNALLNSSKKFNAINYALVIGSCIEMGKRYR